MKVHAILHDNEEKLGIIETWAHERHFDLSVTLSHCKETLPSVDKFDFLISMGGPQNILNWQSYSYLVDEVELIKASIKVNRHLLGICLGAQLLGIAFGAEPKHSPEREVGMWPIEITADARGTIVAECFPETFPVMHWHNDMPGIPPNATVLAKSPGCPRQILQFNDRAFGFQCHPELTPETTQLLIDNFYEKLKPGKYIQPAEDIAAADFRPPNHYLKLFLDKLIMQ